MNVEGISARQSNRIELKSGLLLRRIRDHLINDPVRGCYHIDSSVTWTTVELPPIPLQEGRGQKESSSSAVVNQDVLKEWTSLKTINWCRTASRLAPLRSESVGCSGLLRAVSMAMWGLDNPDVEDLLQRLMHVILNTVAENRFQLLQNDHWRAAPSSTLDVEEILQSFKLDSDGVWEKRHGEVTDFHIFFLSNILRRPIIVLSPSTTSIDEVAGLTGIYLPLLNDSKLCVLHPLILAHHRRQFLPLVVQQDSVEAGKMLPVRAVPLVTYDQEPIPVRCLSDNEARQVSTLIQKFLKVDEINLTRSNAVDMILTARLTSSPIPDEFDVWNEILASFNTPQDSQTEIICRKGVSSARTVEKKCSTSGCLATGLESYNGKCLKCFILPVHEGHGTPSTTYGAPSTEYGALSTEYGASSTEYGVLSTEYGVPSTEYGVPSTAQGAHKAVDTTTWMKFNNNYNCQHPNCFLPAMQGEHRCPEHFVSKETEIIRRRTNNLTPSTEASKHGEGVRCVVPNCPLYGQLKWENRCSQHRQDMEKIAGSTNLSRSQISGATNIFRSQISGATNIFRSQISGATNECRSQVCTNQASPKYGGYCSRCYLTNSAPTVGASTETTPPELMTSETTPPELMTYETTPPELMNYSSSSGHIVVQQETKMEEVAGSAAAGLGAGFGCGETWKRPERTIHDPISRCISGICENIGSKETNGLCRECFQAIQKTKLEKESSANEKAKPFLNVRWNLEERHCIAEGCRFPVANCELGLCQKCFKKQSDVLIGYEKIKAQTPPSSSGASKQQPAWTSEQGYSANYGYLSAGGTSLALQETGKQTKVCLTQTCDRYGDPSFRGYCSVCYNNLYVQ